MHTNYYKIVKLLRSFKIIVVAPTCFGLRKPATFRFVAQHLNHCATAVPALYVQWPLLLSEFKETSILSRDFRRIDNTKIS